MSINRWIKYYRNSLADGELVDIKLKDCEEGLFFNSYSHLTTTKLQKAYAQLQKTDKAKKKKYKEEDGEDDQHLPIFVFISPLHLNAKNLHGKRTKNQYRIFPFWIPAALNEHGKLSPLGEENKLPWFVRSVLHPLNSGSSNSPIIASTQEVDDVLDTHIFSFETWEDHWHSVETFFERVTGSNYSEFEMDGYITNTQICMIRAKSIVSASNIHMVYQDLMDFFQPPNLISNLLTSKGKDRKPLPDEGDLFLKKGHYGQYNNLFPLSNSQRKALLIFEQEEKGKTLAVNGPPGTGKTTLLQSVVANEMVKAAIRGSEPPKILASSTNNQAITNILDSFVSTNDSLTRWLPNIDSLGSYLISSDTIKQDTAIKKGYQILSRSVSKWEGYYFNHFEEADIEQLEQYYILSHRKSSRVAVDMGVEDITRSMKSSIKSLANKIDVTLDTMGRVYQAEADHFPLSQLPEFLARIKELKSKLGQLRLQREQLLSFRDIFSQFVEKHKLLIFFGFIPSLKRRYTQKLGLFLADSPSQELRDLSTNHLVEEVLLQILQTNQKLTDSIEGEMNTKQQLYDKLHPLKVEFDAIEKELDGHWQKYLSTKSSQEKVVIENDYSKLSHIERVNRILDVSHRYRAFVHSVHYWEGEWINLQKDQKLTINKGLSSRTKLFTHISHLTPLFISTFHASPGFCSYREKLDGKWDQKPLYDLFDLLIVDEAGQVAPEVGVAAFSLAEKALVVGDVFQIEPVWNISYTKIDYGNLSEAGLLSDHSFDNLRTDGVLCSSGSLMHLAQRASTYELNSGIGGTLLTEHRRCVDELVAFSNHFVYDDMLQPMVGSLGSKRFSDGETELLLPPLSYMNIKGISEKKVGSSYNVQEAEGIAKWIHAYGKLILEDYNKDRADSAQHELKDIVAVVTPFAEQRNEIYRQLTKYGISTSITVGTVHALQGAERPIVIFSPTYGINHLGGRLFFDSGFNMLNVAITRAKHHFMVMGNMALFNPQKTNIPSGALATYLFAHEENELSSSLLFDDIPVTSKNRVDTLEKHQSCINRAFEVAQDKIVIVSPFISIHAINADGMLEKIEKVTAKGVEVHIYTDKYLDQPKGRLKNSSSQGREALVKAGAKLKILNGIHNKALAIDKKILIEGSFNWLSALRDVNHPHFRLEVSQIMQGKEAQLQIEQLLSGLESVTPSE